MVMFSLLMTKSPGNFPMGILFPYWRRRPITIITIPIIIKMRPISSPPHLPGMEIYRSLHLNNESAPANQISEPAARLTSSRHASRYEAL
jgi:hypothetical protein